MKEFVAIIRKETGVLALLVKGYFHWKESALMYIKKTTGYILPLNKSVCQTLTDTGPGQSLTNPQRL